MTQPVITPSEPQQQQARPHAPEQVSRGSIFALLALVSLLVLLFTGLLVHSLPQLVTPTSAHTTPTQTVAQQDIDVPLALPGNATPGQLNLPLGHFVIYEQQNNIYSVPLTGGTPQSLLTPGYIYNQAVPPLLTPSEQILYSGDGLWLTGIFNSTPRQIATIPAGQIITSLVMSSDGTTIAWSTEPLDGNGSIALYAGTLDQSQLVYQRPASKCPCFRAFAFLEGSSNSPDTTLLLTDDRGDHTAIRSGLWSFNLQNPTIPPHHLLGEETQQGPLTLMAQSNMLLYATAEGAVPAPTDESVPADEASLNYANSLALTTINQHASTLATPQIVLPPQPNLSNSADYRWIATPLFSPDGHTLLYLEFSSDAQAPFDRHFAVYSVQITTAKGTLHTSKPRLIATSSANFVALGAWMNSHTITFYSDNALYVLDIQTGALATIIQTTAYAHIVTIVGQGQV